MLFKFVFQLWREEGIKINSASSYCSSISWLAMGIHVNGNLSCIKAKLVLPTGVISYHIYYLFSAMKLRGWVYGRTQQDSQKWLSQVRSIWLCTVYSIEAFFYLHWLCVYVLLMCCFIFSPGEDVVINWVNPTQSERHWRSTIIMAYHSSPHLAFQFIMATC